MHSSLTVLEHHDQPPRQSIARWMWDTLLSLGWLAAIGVGWLIAAVVFVAAGVLLNALIG